MSRRRKAPPPPAKPAIAEPNPAIVTAAKPTRNRHTPERTALRPILWDQKGPPAASPGGLLLNVVAGRGSRETRYFCAPVTYRSPPGTWRRGPPAPGRGP